MSRSPFTDRLVVYECLYGFFWGLLLSFFFLFWDARWSENNKKKTLPVENNNSRQPACGSVWFFAKRKNKIPPQLVVGATGRGEGSGRLLTRFTFVFDIFTNDARAGRDREVCFLLFFFCCCSCFAAHKCLLFISALRAQFDFPIIAQREKKNGHLLAVGPRFVFPLLRGGGWGGSAQHVNCVCICVWMGAGVARVAGVFSYFFIHTLKLHTPLRARFTIEWVTVCVCLCGGAICACCLR